MKKLGFTRLERHRVGGTDDLMQLTYAAPKTPSGKTYQYSPNPEAAPRLFLIGDAPAGRAVTDEARQRMRRSPGGDGTVCPYSGHIAPDRDYVHFDDVEAVKKQIFHDASADVSDWLSDLTRGFNSRQRHGGFISIKTDYKPAHRPKPLVIREDLLRDLRCDLCQRAYAVYAIALFCPDCGAPNLALHFRREVELIQEQIALADTLSTQAKPELAYRLMGNAHEDVLTAFETTLKTVYKHLLRGHHAYQAKDLISKQSIGNAFQNLDRALEKFAQVGIEPFAHLEAQEREFLRLNIQKRHVIGHNLGIADEHYAELTQSEQPGETVRVIGDEVARFATICLSVVTKLEDSLLPSVRSQERQ